MAGIACDVTARTDAEAALRRSLERDELRVVYQPIMHLATGAVVGVEALVRWAHPERGLILAVEFLPLAEETGLILPIGRWVRGEACRQVRAWQERYHTEHQLRLSTNLSVGEFHQADLVAHLTTTLGESGFSPERLTLEITESAMMATDPEVSVSALFALKWLGVQLALDDFGKEYASLSAFKRFPVDQLKVDRSFVAGLGRIPEDTAIVRAVVDVARALGLTVVAEGVETAEHVAQLRELGCEEGQGYFFAPPLVPEELEAFLRV
ncbi:MAG: EAL domain-containing protein [Chloroflexia bacterium]|nr:EAL domain-containing protein [Chloroflexia bacterium]